MTQQISKKTFRAASRLHSLRVRLVLTHKGPLQEASRSTNLWGPVFCPFNLKQAYTIQGYIVYVLWRRGVFILKQIRSFDRRSNCRRVHSLSVHPLFTEPSHLVVHVSEAFGLGEDGSLHAGKCLSCLLSLEIMTIRSPDARWSRLNCPAFCFDLNDLSIN